MNNFFGIISKFARGIFAHQNLKVYIADFSTNCQSAKAGILYNLLNRTSAGSMLQCSVPREFDYYLYNDRVAGRTA